MQTAQRPHRLTALRGGFFMHARTLYATENSRTVWHDHGDGSVTIQKVADVTNAVF